MFSIIGNLKDENVHQYKEIYMFMFSIMGNLKDEDVKHYKEMFQMFDKVKFC